MPERRTNTDNYSDEYITGPAFDTYCTESDSCECLACMSEMYSEWEEARQSRRQVVAIVAEFERVEALAQVDEVADALSRYGAMRELEEGFAPV